jgi:2-phosphoglycerate kinase
VVDSAGPPLPAANAAVRTRLRHVHWLGGGSGAGKSTLARRLAERHGLRVYATDDVMSAHAERSDPAECPQLAAFTAMDMDERWLNRTPRTMLETFHWFRGEGFQLIVDDLLDLPAEPVIVEGFRLLPRLVAPLLTAREQAVWLLPTPAFRRAALDSRGGTWAIAGKTSDPDRALDNLLERDRMFTEHLRDETRRLGLPAIRVETSTTEDEIAESVAAVLRLPSRDR